MLTHQHIVEILSLGTAEAARLSEYRNATKALEVRLSDDMAAALGSPSGYRRMTPFLGVVTEAVSSKLEVDDESLRAARVADTKAVAKWLGDNAWAILERDLYATVSRDASAFILVRWTETGPDYTIRERYDGTTGAGVYRENGATVLAFNAWKFKDLHCLDVYYPDRIEKYARLSEKKWEPRKDTEDEAWPIAWVDDGGEPLGIALIEYTIGKSDIEDGLQLGRDLNESLLDIIAGSRTQGWPQRWVKGQRDPGLLYNIEGQPLISPFSGKPFQRTMQLSPGSILMLSQAPGDNVEIGQLAPSKTDTATFDALLRALTLVTTIPTHYFTGQWPSGIALIQAEARLNHKVEAHQGRLSSAIVAMIRLSMRLSNYYAGSNFDTKQSFLIPWKAPQIETEDLKRERDKALTERISTLYDKRLMSLEVALRELHPAWSDEEITQETTRLRPVEAPPPPPEGVKVDG